MFGGNYDCDGIKWRYWCEIKDETKLTETAELSVNGRDKSGGWRVKILNRNVKLNNSVQCVKPFVVYVVFSCDFYYFGTFNGYVLGVDNCVPETCMIYLAAACPTLTVALILLSRPL